MIRPFDLSDSLSIFHSASLSLPFDSRQVAIQPIRAFRRALLGRIFPLLHPETYVAFEDGTFQGFAQFTHPMGDPCAHLFLIAPETFPAASCATNMMEMLLTASGARHARYLIAESETHSTAYGFLRRSGFAVYARQTIWRRDKPLPTVPSTPTGSMRPARPTDQPAITALFSSVVPALVQQIENPPTTDSGWALLEEGELVGFFQFSTGSLGSWVEPFFHPSARHAADWLSRLVSDLLNTVSGPLFVCVRSYQEWLGSILQEIGFSCTGDQSVLARRIVAPVAVAQQLQLKVAEGGAPQVTTLTPPSSSLHRGL
jgi:hypothetical protein